MPVGPWAAMGRSRRSPTSSHYSLQDWQPSPRASHPPWLEGGDLLGTNPLPSRILSALHGTQVAIHGAQAVHAKCLVQASAELPSASPQAPSHTNRCPKSRGGQGCRDLACQCCLKRSTAGQTKTAPGLSPSLALRSEQAPGVERRKAAGVGISKLARVEGPSQAPESAEMPGSVDAAPAAAAMRGWVRFLPAPGPQGHQEAWVCSYDLAAVPREGKAPKLLTQKGARLPPVTG